MRFRFLKYKKLALLCFVTSIVLFLLGAAGNLTSNPTKNAAERTARLVNRRVKTLDKYILQVSNAQIGKPSLSKNIPDDIVIYKYTNDSLKQWYNQFTVINDDISAKLEIQRLADPKNRIVSPLNDVTEELRYMNFGPKWYLVKSYLANNSDKIIAGIEVRNSLISDLYQSGNGINDHFKLSDKYTILPLHHSEGYPVTINDEPLFKVANNPDIPIRPFKTSIFSWIALLFLALAAVLFLAVHRTIKVYLLVISTLIGAAVLAFIWGYRLSGSTVLFSPSLYADGTLMFSLGALFITNTFVLLFNCCTYLLRRRAISIIRHSHSNITTKKLIYGTIISLYIIGSIIYVHVSIMSLIENSSLTLELYRWNTNIVYTILIHLSYACIFISILLLVQMLRPIIWKFTKFKYNLFSHKSLAAAAFIWALYITIIAGILGLGKEQDRLQVWANRLAVERDLSLEVQLKSIEDEILSDHTLWSMASQNSNNEIILNRISEYHLNKIRQTYSLNLMIIRERELAVVSQIEEIISSGTPISQNSHFLYIPNEEGSYSYAGIFAFYSKESGAMHMILTIEPEDNEIERGYFSLLNNQSKLGSVNIPPVYSYAKYTEGRLTSYKGNFPYPTTVQRDYSRNADNFKQDIHRHGGFVHFQHHISNEEKIVISRPKRTAMVFFTSFSYLFLAMIMMLQIFVRGAKRKKFKSNYYRRKINLILFISSCLILASMSVVSVLFVYKRNEVNMINLMSSKISTIQALVDNQTKRAESWRDLTSMEFAREIEKISSSTKSDISFFTPEGNVFKSTAPEAFEKKIVGSRINIDAYYNICKLNQRFYIKRNEVSGMKLWTLYAPIFNSRGELIAIITTPYTDRSFDFRREALFHSAMIINLFLLLLIGSLLFSTREVNSMFSPLIEMGKKMKAADINKLEYITYKRDDEISSLVDAYNRMVSDLSYSTRQLAKAERDYAWSQMARQVAHEIKNPLTPIKLELQRLIRLKERNNPAWEEKFDKISAVILEHIDILTDTANEFSTFAKLYSEEPTLLNLDRILKDQLMIFDNKENVKISYLGMENAMVMAPKPQLIRVFVNLITNAIQAVEIQQSEAQESGREIPEGLVMIFLRKSTKEGYYDIVVDDNGPGVKEENLNKLFTPNFTTKSGGTGLGLAICRNIMEKCNGEISYQRSFALGGASFTVTIPIYQEA